MNLTEFTSLLQYPNEITLDQTNAIEDIIDTYPYFQAARTIHLKGLKNHNSFKYNDALKTVAAYTTNRTTLFDFITADVVMASVNLEKEQELINASEVVDIEVIDKSKELSTSVTKEAVDEQIERVAKKLEIGKPLVFDISEMHSFHQWLQLTSVEPIKRVEKVTSKIQKERDGRFELIEEFIKSKPKIKPSSITDNANVAIESTTENKSLMTETLARVYLEQKQYDKAIQAFKILSLKYPEKSGFFADRIKAIKFLQKNKS